MLKTLPHLMIIIFSWACQSPDVASSRSENSGDPRETSEEYLAHREQQRQLNETLNTVMIGFQELSLQMSVPPADQLSQLKQRLLDRGSPSLVVEGIEEIIAKQLDEAITPDQARAFCDQKLDQIEGIYPGFRLGLPTSFSILSCVVSRQELGLMRMRKALICQVREAMPHCMSELSAEERRHVENILSSAGVSYEN